MEQIYSNKIVSLHLDHCTFECPHVKVCYHRRKKTIFNQGGFRSNFIKELLKYGVKIHESVCKLQMRHIDYLTNFNNYNITLPYQLVTNHLLNFKNQIQVSIYNETQAKILYDYQKLFLLKDKYTFSYSKTHNLWKYPLIHFNVSQEWITKEILKELIVLKLTANSSVTLDSCIENYLLNGRCPYGHNNYVDITFDGSLRSCPFSLEGIPIRTIFNGEYSSLFNIPHLHNECKYKLLFGETNG